jgi:murein L,D-transpeptidase YafK
MKKFIILLLFFFLCSLSYAQNSIDMIIIDKSQRILKLMKNGIIMKEYIIDLGFDPIGHKYFKGDGKTPEGLYFVSNKSTNSDFYISLQVSYPNKWDKRNARLFSKDAGNYIMIHGEPNLKNNTRNLKDWTNGCIALKNKDVKEVYELVSINTPIYIQP